MLYDVLAEREQMSGRNRVHLSRAWRIFGVEGFNRMFRVQLRLLAAFAALAVGLPAAQAMDSLVVERGAPDLRAIRAMIKAKQYEAAYEELKKISATTQHADIYSLMGFSLRKMHDYKQAATWYSKALDFNPNHKGALEYQGEMFAEIGQIEKAKANLVRLTALCPKGCEERSDLANFITKTTVNAKTIVNANTTSASAAVPTRSPLKARPTANARATADAKPAINAKATVDAKN